MVPKIGTKIEPRGPGFPGPRGLKLVPEFATKMIPKSGTEIVPREPIFRALALNFSCPADKKNGPENWNQNGSKNWNPNEPRGLVFLALGAQNWFQNLEPRGFQKLAPKLSSRTKGPAGKMTIAGKWLAIANPSNAVKKAHLVSPSLCFARQGDLPKT